MKSLASAIISAMALCAMSTPSAALVVYNNLGPGDSFNPNIGWAVEHNLWTPSMSFTTSDGGYLSQVSIAVFKYDTRFDSSIQLYLHANEGLSFGGSPGAILETMHLNVAGNNPGVQIATALGTTLLTEHTVYWLTATSLSQYGWNYNDTGALGYTTVTQGPIGGAWANSSFQTLAAFKVRVADAAQSVPEPGTFSLLIMALLGLARSAGRRSRRSSHYYASELFHNYPVH